MKLRVMISNITVLVITFLICFVSGELVIRIHHGFAGGPERVPAPSPYRAITEKGSRLVPGVDVLFQFESTFKPVRVRINKHGFRGPELNGKSGHAGKRLLVLGDSVTFGYGVREGITFVALLDSLLNMNSPSPHSWQTINAGVEDVGTREERMILQEKGDEIRPHGVIVAFYANDSRPPVGFRQEYLIEDPIDRWFRVHPAVLTRSHFASFLHFRYRRLLTTLSLYRSPVLARFAWVKVWQESGWKTSPDLLDSLVTLARYDWGSAWIDESWISVRGELSEIKQWCDDRGVVLGVCYLPVQIQAEAPRPMPIPSSKLGRICRDLDIGFEDLLPVLRGEEGCYIDQCHLTPKGHRLVARALFPWVMEVLEPTQE